MLIAGSEVQSICSAMTEILQAQVYVNTIRSQTLNDGPEV